MNFNVIDASNGDTLLNLFGEPVVYRRCNGETIVTDVEIDTEVEVFGETESGAMEYRTEIVLLVADIGEPRRGDSIITADGTTYTVHTLLRDQSDKVQVTVSVK